MSPTKQKALLLKEKFGEFVLAEVSVLKPAKNQVLVKIHASALNPVDWKVQKYGIFYQDSQYPVVLGSDIAGEVVELGEGVSQVTVGDRVFLQGVIGDNDQSGFQQYAIADVFTLAKIPPKVTYDEASTIPVGITAPYVGLYQASPYGFGFGAPTKPENRGKYKDIPIVVLGGASAVGHFALQLAKISGFSPIITTASPRHEVALKALGATHVLDRSAAITESQLKAITSSPIKHIIDAISTAETQKQGFDILSPEGKQVLVLEPEAFWEEEGKKQQKTAIHVFGSKIFPQHLDLLKDLWGSLAGLLEEGFIKPHNVEVLPKGLNGIVEGLKKSEEGKVSNTKLVARPQETA